MGEPPTERAAFAPLVPHRSKCKISWAWDLGDALESRHDLDPSERPLVIDLLRSRSEVVVTEAINLLARAGVTEALPAIWRCRCQWDCLVRVAQVEATWDLGGRGFEPLVRRRLRDPHCLVRQWAVDVYLARYPQLARALFPRLLRREWASNVRVRLLLVLYGWGDKTRLGPALETLLEPDRFIRSVVIDAFREMAAPEDIAVELAKLRSRLAVERDDSARDHLAKVLAAAEEAFGPGDATVATG